MPIYEYTCHEDGSVIELIRPMAQADAPVEDPSGKGRTFTRTHSTFQTGSSASSSSLPQSSHIHSGSCGCGKPRGSCSNN
ncbi:MAG: zinc ribbon domain-containing protein [Phycisphaerales bacterium]|nr:zinc ribbon domain-containing protein [Phycisphaerales bacterium]